MRRSLSRLGAAAALAAGLYPLAAAAGAWTQLPGQGQATLSLYGYTGTVAPNGWVTPPKENEVETQLYIEYGLVDRLMVFGSVALERNSILSPVDNTYLGPDYSQIGLQYQVAKFDDWVFSASTSLFVPGARNGSEPAQAGNTGAAVEVRGLAGRSFALGSGFAFVDAELAYRNRSAGPPDEWHGDLTIGYKPNTTWTFMLQSFNEVTDGSGAPGYLAITESLEQASVLYAFDTHWTLQVGVFATAVSIGTNSERGAVVSITKKF
jgi:hypothetical protein